MTDDNVPAASQVSETIQQTLSSTIEAPRTSQAASEKPQPVSPALKLDEPSLMRLLRAIKDSNPSRAAELAREGNLRYSESSDAPERASVLIHALVELGRASEARGEAEDMVNRYPDSSWVREVEQFTGAHRHRNIRLNKDGRLEYY